MPLTIIEDLHPPVGRFAGEVIDDEPEPSTLTEGGWRPWDDGRDSAGRTYAEWVDACFQTEQGREPKAPAQPRFRGLYPPGPRKQPVPDAPDAPRQTVVDGKPVVRLDTYARKPSKKTRAKNAATKGTTYPTKKDIIVLETVVAWGALTRDQIAGFLGLNPNSLVRRLAKLTALGVLHRGKSLQGVAVYSVTAGGCRLIGAEGWTTPRPSLLRYDHTQAAIETALWVAERFPTGVVVSEREIQHAGYDADGRIGPDGDLGPRLNRVAPWLASQAGNDFSLWSPRIHYAGGGTVGRKRPDLLLVREGQRPIVIEIELHEKTKPLEYPEMLAAYGVAQQEGHIGEVIYLVSESASLSAKRLATLLDRARSKCHLQAGKKAKVVVKTLPADVWQPLAVRLHRGSSRA